MILIDSTSIITSLNPSRTTLPMATFEEIEKYVCIICKELLTDPVILPCSHTTCLYCLERTLDYCKYQCFLCRKSIQSWYRNSRRKNCLINEKLRDEIQSKFKDLIERRLNGESLDIIFSENPKLIISSPGEIKQDFESELKKLQSEIEKEKEKENKLSEELIKQIEEEENRRILEEEEKLRKDEEMARELAQQLEASYSEEKDHVLKQVDVDEALAKKLAQDLLTPKKRSIKSAFETENVKRLKSDQKAEFRSRYSSRLNDTVTETSPHGAGLHARSLRSSNNSPVWRSKLSPKMDKSKKNQSVSKYGPMDRFVETKKTTSR